jgi:hypothetical protein
VSNEDPRARKDQLACLDGEVMEVQFLLPQWQAAALEQAASRQGLTSGQLTRRLIRAYLAKAGLSRTAPDGDGASAPS